MKSGNGIQRAFNYSDLFLNSFFSIGSGYLHNSTEHLIIFIYSGELVILESGQEISVKSGESVFIRKDMPVKLYKKNDQEEMFQGIIMGFSRPFLSECYKNVRKKQILSYGGKLECGIVRLPKTPYIQSLHVSMIPYFQWGVKPSGKILELKLREGIYCLLLLDNRFFTCLFDFMNPWGLSLISIPCHKN
ncbi:MAG: hypothetical protein LBQ60_07945 [Bacteroidales bacterium]|jgi:hypothetical protein|nr:hypothetical protein [Bacteroidales bacterium]